MSCVVFRVRFAESRPFGTHPQIPSMADPDSSNLLSSEKTSASQGSGTRTVRERARHPFLNGTVGEN